mmetsp:Transcript_146587/g.207916  ORF Transcript_146587/g.207916 Transcript_146587/m.207916 type:complete len:203 (+) Transcript_146587:69-677(+)
MRQLFGCLLVASLCKASAQEKRPIVTTDLVHGTGELLYDIYSAVYNKLLVHHVEKHSKTVREAIEPMMPEDPMGEICNKVGVEKKQVLQHMDSAASLASSASEQAQAHVSRVHQMLSQVSTVIIDGFERLLPSHRGVIKRSPGDLVMFCLWVVAVLYVTMKVSIFFGKIAWRIFIFTLKMLCCCGCCGLLGSRKSPPGKKTK